MKAYYVLDFENLYTLLTYNFKCFWELANLNLSILPRKYVLALQRRKPRTKEVKEFAHGHSASQEVAEPGF